MPTADELRARLEAADAEHEAARERYEAFSPPPMGDATPQEYQAHDEADRARFEAFIRREDAWFTLDAKLHPQAYAGTEWAALAEADHGTDAQMAADEADPEPEWSAEEAAESAAAQIRAIREADAEYQATIW